MPKCVDERDQTRCLKSSEYPCDKIQPSCIPTLSSFDVWEFLYKETFCILNSVCSYALKCNRPKETPLQYSRNPLSIR